MTVRTSGFSAGLSPPTRGSLRQIVDVHRRPGSIPAHAGEPRRPFVSSAGRRVYPRPRGGAVLVPITLAILYGLSPPTRGSRGCLPLCWRRQGSIPAHAGEPQVRFLVDRSFLVYPRPRGGAAVAAAKKLGVEGLSPPTRGSRRCYRGTVNCGRSIPAHAGEPFRTWLRGPFSRVYPRPRGGARPVIVRSRARSGLSPPTRGSRPGAHR